MADMRDRLIELLCAGTLKTEICTTETHLECESCRGDCGYCTILADHLLASGVILPPCEVGDAVYFPIEIEGEDEAFADVGTVFAIGIDERHIMWISARYESGLKYYHTSYDFGKTVFLTRGEAENALKERNNNEKR